VKSIKEIYEAYKFGDNLTNAEVLQGFQHFNQVAKLTNAVGNAYILVAQDALRTAYDLEGFAYSRKLRPEDYQESSEALLLKTRAQEAAKAAKEYTQEIQAVRKELETAQQTIARFQERCRTSLCHLTVDEGPDVEGAIAVLNSALGRRAEAA
jgi:hypothetical protein